MSTKRVYTNMIRNPTGRGGFRDHPEHRKNGYWRAEDSISFQYKRFVMMSVDEFNTWLEDNPEGKRTTAQELAYMAVVKARRDLKYLVELTDRTEGRSQQNTNITGVDNQPLIIIKDYGNKTE
jgi:hypothetical protein